MTSYVSNALERAMREQANRLNCQITLPQSQANPMPTSGSNPTIVIKLTGGSESMSVSIQNLGESSLLLKEMGLSLMPLAEGSHTEHRIHLSGFDMEKVVTRLLQLLEAQKKNALWWKTPVRLRPLRDY